MAFVSGHTDKVNRHVGVTLLHAVWKSGLQMCRHLAVLLHVISIKLVRAAKERSPRHHAMQHKQKA